MLLSSNNLYSKKYICIQSKHICILKNFSFHPGFFHIKDISSFNQKKLYNEMLLF